MSKDYLTRLPVVVEYIDSAGDGKCYERGCGLCVNHPRSQYGIPVVDLGNGRAISAHDIIKMKIGWDLVQRELGGATQRDLSNRLGVSIRTVQSWFAGRHTPPLYALSALFRSA